MLHHIDCQSVYGAACKTRLMWIMTLAFHAIMRHCRGYASGIICQSEVSSIRLWHSFISEDKYYNDFVGYVWFEVLSQRVKLVQLKLL